MTISARALNRCTLRRQLLDHRASVGAGEAIRRVVAVQAQEAASPYVALWTRVQEFDPADLDAAFATHDVVKATLVRMTLHAVHRDDYPSFHTAMAMMLRTVRLADPRFAAAGADADEVTALLPRLTEYAATPRTNLELAAEVDSWLPDAVEPGPWWAIRLFAPLVHAPTSPPWSFTTRPSYLATPHAPSDEGAEACVRRLVRRYLEGFGPATVPDIAQFTKLPRATVRGALAGLDEFEGEKGTLYDVPGAEIVDRPEPVPPRLMAMWDSVLFAYADRRRIIADEYRRHIIRTNGDTLPTLMVDGYVAGVWRATDDGIEVGAFAPLPARVWKQVRGEAERLQVFLADRDPLVYKRYARWWTTLPLAESKVCA